MAFTVFTMIDFILGNLVGAIIVGGSVTRTLEVYKGNVMTSFMINNLCSAAYYFSVHFIAQNNNVAFIGTCTGSAAVISYLAYRNKHVHPNQTKK